MTEQPGEPLPGGHRIQSRPASAMVPAERTPLVEKFLGVVDGAFDRADANLVGRRATDAGLALINRDIEESKAESRRGPLDLQAEIAAGHAVAALSSGELDEGIAWLQSALAFAQNHRHATRHEGTAQ